MGKKRALKDLWIAIFALVGATLIVFSESVLQVLGVILVIISIIISISKAWVK